MHGDLYFYHHVCYFWCGVVIMSAILCAAAAIGNRKRISLTISTNTNVYSLNAASLAGYEAGITDVILTVDAGKYVYSTGNTIPAMSLGVGFSAGDSITLINNGYILGGGGYGAYTTAASNGGPAIKLFCNTAFINTGYICGGGGGGGGVRIGSGPTYNYVTGGGGSGGGGGGNTTNGGFTPGGGGLDGTASVVISTGGGGGIWPTNTNPNNGTYITSSTPGVSTSTKGLGGPNGGTGAVILDVGAGGTASGQAGDGGRFNGQGGQGIIWSVSAGFTAVSGGGGGWGAYGGIANFATGSGTPYTIFAPGSGGKAIELNGYNLSGGGGTIWGNIS